MLTSSGHCQSNHNNPHACESSLRGTSDQERCQQNRHTGHGGLSGAGEHAGRVQSHSWLEK